MKKHLRGIRFSNSIVLALIAIGSIGCESEQNDGHPPRANVAGMVTLNGTPVEGATVRLYPKASDGKGATGRTLADGKFQLTTFNPGDGVLPGDYVVTVSKTEVEEVMSEEEKLKMQEMGRPIPKAKKTELLPKETTNPKTSDLSISVTLDGENKLDIALSK